MRDNCTTAHMWLASSSAKPLSKQQLRRPSSDKSPSNVQVCRNPLHHPGQCFDCGFSQILSNVFLRFSKLYFSECPSLQLRKVLCSGGFPCLFLRQLSLESAAVSIPAGLRQRSVYTAIAVTENELEQHETKMLFSKS